MPYSGSDGDPLCDVCNKFDYHEMLTPWPFRDAWHRLNDRPQHNLFLICGDCARKAVLAYVRGVARRDALFNADRFREDREIREAARLACEKETIARLNADPFYQEQLLLAAAKHIVEQAADQISSEPGGRAAR
jgi:hypothetical protein